MNMEYTGKTSNTQKRKPKGDIKYNIDLNGEQKEAKRLIMENDITVLKGQAGSGKTILSCLIALDLYNKREIEKIIICRPAVSKEEIGFLPGGADDKLQPYIQPIHNNFYKLTNKQKVDEMIKEGVIQMIPLAYMRGHTFQDSFIIVDECLTADTKISTRFRDGVGSITKDVKLITIIKNFKKGKEVKVLSYNESLDLIEEKEVISIFENGLKDIKTIFIDNREKGIRATDNHPFAILDNGYIKYVDASELKINDNLLRLVKPNTNNSRILSGDNYDVLLGLLLGDGCLIKNSKKTSGYRLAINHGLQQLEYGEYCRDVFNGVLRDIKSGYTNKPLHGFITKTMFIDDKFINSIYDGEHKKRITNTIEDYMTERTLAFWYMDDGSYYNGVINLHTNNFSNEENEILIKILKSKFGIESKLLKTKSYPYLQIDVKNGEKFLKLIENHIHPNISYKVKDYNEENFKKVNQKFIDNFSVSKIRDIVDSGCEETYNIEVKDNNNYMANSILVHNCQNLIHTQTELIIGRLGMRSKMVLCGDTSQVDLRNKKESGLSFLSGLDGRVKGFKVITLKENHRHPIVAEVLNIYKEFND
jgi:phosphate starvation-inducible protein PhoH